MQENPRYYEIKLHIGIEVFSLYASPKKDLYHDERLLSRLKALGLTPATVLHHLGILMGAELIEIQVTSGQKKVYYQVRMQGLEEVSREILQLTMSRKELETQLNQKIQREKICSDT